MKSSTKFTMNVRHSVFDLASRQVLNQLSLATTKNPGVADQLEVTAHDAHAGYSDMIADLASQATVADSMVCNCCQANFADRVEQLAHYRSDWHRYNLHLRLKDLPCVSEEQFEDIAGDVSSISGSDSEDNDTQPTSDWLQGLQGDTESVDASEASLTTAERAFHKVFFRTKEGDLISVFRCVLHNKKNLLHGNDQMLAAIKNVPEKKRWMVLMVSSGHFAGTVFFGNEVVDHKTFHRYTVRAKRGTAQSISDKQGGPAKSAGATLRRYNEAALIREVQELLSKWEEHIKACDLVFVRIPVGNKDMFFGGKNPAFKKDDSRLRVIPFVTRRPTFNETKRVQQILSTVEHYGQAEVSDVLPSSNTRISNQDKGLSGKQSVTPLKQKREKGRGQEKQQSTYVSEARDNSQERSNVRDVTTAADLSLAGVKSGDETLQRKQAESLLKDEDQRLLKWKNVMYTACKTGCLDSVQPLLKEVEEYLSRQSIESSVVSGIDSQRSSRTLVNLVNDSSKTELGNEQVFSGGNDSSQTELGNEQVLFSGGNNSSKTELGSELVFSGGNDSSKTELGHEQVLFSGGNNSSKTELVSHLVFSGGSVTENSATSQLTTEARHLQTVEAVNGSSVVVEPLKDSAVSSFLNTRLSQRDNTFLHVAAESGHASLVSALLRLGANPAHKNKDGKTPYNLGGAEVRKAFRRFMADFPSACDYKKAEIPSPLTAEQDSEQKQKAAEKRKTKKMALQEKNKDKKAAEAKLREENQERDRFLALSDREKRALAAERRMLQQCENKGVVKPVLSRCWQCGTDMTGKTPFEYFDFKFCTTKCLKEHRAQAAASKHT